MIYTITHNRQFDSLEVTFDGKPAEAVRDFLKGLKFRWHGKKQCWYGFAKEYEVTDGLNTFTAENTEDEPIKTGGVVGDGYMGGGEWTGCNSGGEYRSYGEINKIVKKEMKRRYPGITFKTRGDSYSGGQSSHFYICLTTDQLFKTREDYIHDYMFNDGREWHELPDGSSVQNQNITQEQREAAAAYEYDNHTAKYSFEAHNPNSYRGDNYYTKYALDILRDAMSLYTSFIHDETNSMVDYFNRNLYDHYSFINLDNADKRESWEV